MFKFVKVGWLPPDPGHSRLRIAVAGTVSLAGVMGLLWCYALRTLPGSLFLTVILGGVGALQISSAMMHPRWQDRLRCASWLPIAGGVGVSVGVAALHLGLQLIGFVAVTFATVAARRYGPQFVFHGLVCWVAYFIGVFLHPRGSELPWLVGAEAIAGLGVFAFSLALWPHRPHQQLRHALAVWRTEIRDLLTELADHLQRDSLTSAARASIAGRLLQVNNTALVVEGWLAAVDQQHRDKPTDVDDDAKARALTRWQMIDSEFALDEIVAAAPELSPDGRRASAPMLRALATSDTDTAMGLAAQISLAHRGEDAESRIANSAAALARIAQANPADPAHPTDLTDVRATDSTDDEAADPVGPTGPTDTARATGPTDTARATALTDAADERGPGGLSTAGRNDPARSTGFTSAVQLAPGGALPGTAAFGAQLPSTGHHLLANLSLPMRQAIQATIAMAITLPIAYAVTPAHYTWSLIAVFIVFLGPVTRGEVLLKAAHRCLGTVAGLVIAVPIAFATQAQPIRVLLVCFICCFVGLYLMTVSYSFLMCAVTIAVVQMYELLGQFNLEMLEMRLLATVFGAAVAAAVSSFVVPIRTRETTRWVARQLFDEVAELLDRLAVRVEHGEPTRVDEIYAATRVIENSSRHHRAAGAPLRWTRHRDHHVARDAHLAGFVSRVRRAATRGDTHPDPAGLASSLRELARQVRQLANDE